MTPGTWFLVGMAAALVLVWLGYLLAWLRGLRGDQEYDDLTPYGVLVTPEEWQRWQDEGGQSRSAGGPTQGGRP